MTTNQFDHTVDVLVVGSGGGGMTAALAADASGLDTLVVEKSPQFGGSTALSGGGIWVPGAPSQRKEGYVPDPDGVFEYLRQITGGLVSDAQTAPVRRDRAGDDGVPREPQPVVRIRMETGLCGLLSRAARRLRTRQHHQRAGDRSAQARRRGTEPAAAAGTRAQRDLVRPQRSSAVLPGTPELARQGSSGETDLANVPGAGVR